MVTYPYTVPFVNPGAEAGTVTDWPNRFTCGGTQAWASLNSLTDGVSARSGSRFFRWGTNSSSGGGCQEGGQIVTLADADLLADIDAGKITATAKVWVTKGSSATTDAVAEVLAAYDGSDVALGRWQTNLIVPTTAGTYQQLTLTVPLPPGTRKLLFAGRTTRPLKLEATAIFADDIEVTLDVGEFNLRPYANLTGDKDGDPWVEDTPTLGETIPGSRWGEGQLQLQANGDSAAHVDFAVPDTAVFAIEGGVAELKVYFALRATTADNYINVGARFLDAADAPIGSDVWFFEDTEITTQADYFDYHLAEVVPPPLTRTVRLLWKKTKISGATTAVQMKDIQAYLVSEIDLAKDRDLGADALIEAMLLEPIGIEASAVAVTGTFLESIGAEDAEARIEAVILEVLRSYSGYLPPMGSVYFISFNEGVPGYEDPFPTPLTPVAPVEGTPLEIPPPGLIYPTVARVQGMVLEVLVST